MSKVRKKLLILLLLIFVANNASAIVGNKILIVSSYGIDYQWSNSIIDEIKAEINDDSPDIELNIEYLTSERFNEPHFWVERINMLLNNYQNELPLAIVLISDEAWMAYREANNEQFKDVPIFLCAVKPHNITIDKYIQHINQLALTDFTSTQHDMKKFNSTGILRKLNVEGYVSLMTNLIPNIDQYTIITDNRFYGIYTRLLLEEYFKNNSSIPVKYLDARYINTDQLFEAMNDVTPRTGLLLTSWLTGQSGYEYSKQYLYKKLSSVLKTPIFITNDIGLNTGYFLGGYYYDSQFWGQQVSKMIIKMLNGIPMKDIAVETTESKQCKANWDVLKSFDISSEKLPHDTEYINRPESIFVKYRDQLIILSVILLFVLGNYIYVLNSNIKLKRARKLAQQAAEQAEIANRHLIDTQDNLKIALVKAEAADRLKTAFISNINHQIRTPLNSIVGFSSLISSMDNQEDIDEAAAQIAENSEKLIQIVKGVLDVSQLESGTTKFDYGKIDINGLFDELITSSWRRCKQGVTIKFNPPAKPFSMITDYNRLLQVLTNLTNNALKYTSSGTIEVGYFKCDDQWVEFYVSDTGIGIKQDDLKRIFDRFYKSDSYQHGVGLGLTITKQIIEMLGGTYGVTSELGVGSRFWFRIKKI